MAEVFRHPMGVYQKESRAPSCIVRPPTVVDLIVEVPVWIAPTALHPVPTAEQTVSGATLGVPVVGNPKLG